MKGLAADRPFSEADFRRQGYAPGGHAGLDDGGPLGALQLFCAIKGDVKSKRDIIGDMVAADGDASNGGNNSVRIGHVIGRAATKVNQNDTVFLLIRGENRKCGADA